MAASPINVLIWNEFRHERTREDVKVHYPDGIHALLVEKLSCDNFQISTATLDDPENGLSESRLDETDVLIWWGHMAHLEVEDSSVERVYQRVLEGMGLIALHSAHDSKIFKKLLGTTCSLKWRVADETELLWNIEPSHPICEGIGDHIRLDVEEMYGERFDIPQPDELLFVSWFAGGEVFRSGCTWQRGHGRIFYFRPGHETYPTYHQPEIIRVINNAIHWAAPRIRQENTCVNAEPVMPLPFESTSPSTD
ncbi:ThuA domain-containing protein [Calycomorphotria hydatis]|uniref:Trehalose utilization n=1 Tax=Calycomorphotria hydatis TaxID=2528027 RepID=A0A517T6F7_9PLAN|nr:ThuA domain-containing protein [Calycomorphotria hydatis]QDT63959.1 Trehalose utilization [Calycomorphotria hydatis]